MILPFVGLAITHTLWGLLGGLSDPPVEDLGAFGVIVCIGIAAAKQNSLKTAPAKAAVLGTTGSEHGVFSEAHLGGFGEEPNNRVVARRDKTARKNKTRCLALG